VQCKPCATLRHQAQPSRTTLCRTGVFLTLQRRAFFCPLFYVTSCLRCHVSFVNRKNLSAGGGQRLRPRRPWFGSVVYSLGNRV
jgi:hypothetical protein